jgi:hypothetical protein
MRSDMAVCASLGLLAVMAPEAGAQLSCGQVSVANTIYQEGSYRYVWVQANTTRDINMCPLQLQTEAWVQGVGDADSARGVYSAPLRLGRPVPTYGTWHSRGKHWLIWYPGLPFESWSLFSETHALTDVVPPPDPDPEYECYLAGGTWTGSECQVPNCPLVVDTAGNGIALTSAEDGVWFDLDADGVPERVAWTRAESDDAWLAMDRNGNGVIDSGAELFGNRSPAYANEAEPTTVHGFAALGFLENPSYGRGRADRVIDAADAAFGRLVLWFDRNHDGVSQPDELVPLSHVGLVSLATAYKESRRRDRHGNEFRLRGTSVWQDQGRTFTRSVVDVWLRSVP